MAKPKKPAAKAKEFAFEKGDFVVYPTHGVGRVIDIEAKEIAGHKLDLFVISFEQERMMLRVPVAKAKISGLRKLSSRKIMENALVTLKGRSRVSRAMWNRRAQEYEAKINSGDIVAIAEVVRDLYRSDTQPEQSYSERQLYEAALDRLSREISAVQRITETEAIKEIEAALAKGPRRGPKPAEGEAEDEESVVEEEAA
jgi:CarD family transcriptional regulator